MVLKEWLEVHNSIEDINNIILHLDYAMKKNHLDFNCVSDFDPKKISLNADGAKFEAVFKPNRDDFLQYRNRDIISLACLSVGMYLGNTSILLAPNVISEKFNTHVASLLPEDRVDYYRGIFVNNDRGYLCDNLVQNVSNVNANTNARYLVKTSAVGKMMFDDGSKTGFVSVKVLGILSVIFIIVGVILYFILFAD